MGGRERGKGAELEREERRLGDVEYNKVGVNVG